MNIYIVMLLITVSAAAVCIVFAVSNRRLMERYRKLSIQYDGLKAALERINEIGRIKEEERADVSKKIDNLHGGIVSADDILPKPGAGR